MVSNKAIVWLRAQVTFTHGFRGICALKVFVDMLLNALHHHMNLF
jgi:hypothetical protein